MISTSCKGDNDKIVLALIGAGNQGTEYIINCCKINENVVIKTICDVNTTKLAKAMATVKKILGLLSSNDWKHERNIRR